MPPKRRGHTPLARVSRPAPRTRETATGARPSTPERPPALDRVRQGLGSIQAPTGYQHVLMGEMVVAFFIIGIRAVADYVPASDMRQPGTESPKKGAPPIVLIVSTLGVFFVLSFLATRGGWAARASSTFGLLMIIALMINSESELAEVGTWIENIGTNNASQSAPQQASTANPTTTTPPDTEPGPPGKPPIHLVSPIQLG